MFVQQLIHELQLFSIEKLNFITINLKRKISKLCMKIQNGKVSWMTNNVSFQTDAAIFKFFFKKVVLSGGSLPSHDDKTRLFY